MAVTPADLQLFYPTATADKSDGYLQAWITQAEGELDPTALGAGYDLCVRELAMYYITTDGVAGNVKSLSSSVSGGSGSVSIGNDEENTHWIRYQRQLRKSYGLTAMTAGGGSW